jgi:hypothetical protein
MLKAIFKRLKFSDKNFELSLNAEVEPIFTEIYHNNGFIGDESISGPGSDMIQTKVIQEQIPLLIQELKIRVLIDAPCGDFYWMKEVEMDFLEKYIGVDIVEDLVNSNQQKYGNRQRKFIKMDITHQKFPKSDLILCRDCLVHLPFKEIFSTISNFKQSGAKYLLTTTFTDIQENIDIAPGLWRPINLQLHPFNFSTPIQILNEGCTENDGQYMDKSLGLWYLSDLPSSKE